MPTSNTRPWRRTLPRNERLNCLPRRVGHGDLAARRPSSAARPSRAAMSMPIGQRVVQASHEAHSQIACEPSTSASAPRWTSRITWLGSRSMSGPIGQPVEHLWHWKQALTGVPLRAARPSSQQGCRRRSMSSRCQPCVYSPIPSISASTSASLRGHHLAVHLGRAPQHAVDGQQVALDPDAEQPLVLFAGRAGSVSSRRPTAAGTPRR